MIRKRSKLNTLITLSIERKIWIVGLVWDLKSANWTPAPSKIQWICSRRRDQHRKIKTEEIRGVRTPHFPPPRGNQQPGSRSLNPAATNMREEGSTNSGSQSQSVNPFLKKKKFSHSIKNFMVELDLSLVFVFFWQLIFFFGGEHQRMKFNNIHCQSKLTILTLTMILATSKNEI